jgi:DNA processing protein
MTPGLPEEAYAAALASVAGVGPASLRELLAAHAPSAAWASGQYAGDVDRIWQKHQDHEIEVLLRESPGYPARLHDDPEAPAVLFCRGDPLGLSHRATVALVGTRSPTRYGISVAAQLGAELAALDVSVVSGLALGIDAAAHEGACGTGAPPLAVMAGGLDHPYPARNARLFERVVAQGAVVSESPAGGLTEKWRFPVRNRLLAALSDAVVVVESRHQSGTEHTVAAASSRGIPVGAVPGSIRSPTSEGPNALLADGCFPVRDVGDILVALGLVGIHIHPGSGSAAGAPAAVIEANDAQLLGLLTSDPTSLERLLVLSRMELAALCGGLERLARAGVARDIGGWWERT